MSVDAGAITSRKVRGMTITAAARRAGVEAYQARTAERRAKLAPIIQELQAVGITGPSGMAAALNARGVPTLAGRRHWYPTQIVQLLRRLEGCRRRVRTTSLKDQRGVSGLARG